MIKERRIPEKKDPPAPMNISIPGKLQPIIKAFTADEPGAKLLILEAANSIAQAERSDSYLDDVKRDISKDELEGIIALMKGLAPRDTLEMIYAAQIICSHLMGLKMLCHSHGDDQILGLKLLRFSNEAMGQLQKKRAGGISQNINIVYSHSGPALMQTVNKGGDPCQ